METVKRDRRQTVVVNGVPWPVQGAQVAIIDAGRIVLQFRPWPPGWELPGGHCEDGEDPAITAAREAEEETGYRPGPVRPMIAYNALSGISDMRFTAFLAEGAERIGPPSDPGESSQVEWVPLADVPRLAAQGQIQDGPSLTALTYYLAVERPP